MMKKIKQIKQTKFSRGLFAVKSALKVVPKVFNKKDQSVETLLHSLVGDNINAFVDELGTMKGSILKAAQMLTAYAEYYFPAELNQSLRKLLNQTHYLDFEKVKSQIPNELQEHIEIQETPIAAASIGQVHRGMIKENGENVVLKIQYPGVRKAVEIDIFILKRLVSVLNFLPRKINLDDIYLEIKKMLIAEMDYKRELLLQDAYRHLDLPIENIYIPQVYPHFSHPHILVSEYVQGKSLAEITPESLSQEKRNKIGEKIMSLYFFEIFLGGIVQTDCHAGNFLIREKDNDIELVLIDFGACVSFSEETLLPYRQLIRSLYRKDKLVFLSQMHAILNDNKGAIQLNDDDIWDYVGLAMECMEYESYDWGKTDLPDRLMAKAKILLGKSHIEKPPHKFIFLDRKLLGVFSILRQLQCVLPMKKFALQYLE